MNKERGDIHRLWKYATAKTHQPAPVCGCLRLMRHHNLELPCNISVIVLGEGTLDFAARLLEQ
jgi:hypothetical protein